MLFIHKNAFQLYHTMSDFTSGTEAVFGGNSSPVIQMIPKSKCFRLHVENRQQQVKTLSFHDVSPSSELVCAAISQPCFQAYDRTTQPEQSQYLLRSGVTHLAGTSSSGRISPPVTHIDIDHNYSRGIQQNSTDMHLELLQLKKEKLQLEILNAKLWNKVLVLQKDVLDIQKQNLQTSSTASPVQSPKIAFPLTNDVPYVLPKFSVIG
ncbi:uncharacterized protein [Scyliorhinus torazame]|uniref:uncharacterized protein n=1 Tax=Scyliorhinus torazame TaxID=75743 RepID=UPI003B5BF27A